MENEMTTTQSWNERIEKFQSVKVFENEIGCIYIEKDGKTITATEKYTNYLGNADERLIETSEIDWGFKDFRYAAGHLFPIPNTPLFDDEATKKVYDEIVEKYS